MSDYPGLLVEIGLPAYAGLTDAQIADALRAPIAVRVDTPIAGMLNILLAAGEWPRIEWRAQQARTAATPPDTAGTAAMIAVRLADQVAAGLRTVATSSATETSKLGAALTALVVAGDISMASVAAIQLLSQASTTRAAQLGFPPNADMATEIAAARRVV